MSSHLAQVAKPYTYRVQNIPFGTTAESLKQSFYVEDQDDIKVMSLVQCAETPETSTESGDYTATIYFNPRTSYRGPPRLSSNVIDVDKDFWGFTPLYVPSKSPISADIIAVAGLAGHAYGSWACSPEQMWLRDFLPRDAPNARILIYGYPSRVQNSDSRSILGDFANTFVNSLIVMREDAECESRPIIFIGHSLGCLIIKKALTEVHQMVVNKSRLPVRAIVFLGAPHRGLNVDAISTLVKDNPTERLIEELRSESTTLTDLNQRFSQVAKDIDILTCYEAKHTKTIVNVEGEWRREGPAVMMVSPDSAQLFSANEQAVQVVADHSEMSKIRKGQNGVYPNIRGHIKKALISTAKIVATNSANGQERSSTGHKKAHRASVLLSERFNAWSSSSPIFPPQNNSYPKTSACSDLEKTRVTQIEVNEVDPLLTPSGVVDVLPSDNELIKAIKIGDMVKVIKLVQDSKQVTEVCNGTALHLASELRLESCVRLLLENGAKSCLNTRDIKGRTPLLIATAGTMPNLLAMLLEYGADINIGGYDTYKTPLHVACELGDKEIVRILLNAKPELNRLTTDSLTPLYIAAKRMHTEAIVILLEAGADPNSKNDERGITPLMAAALNDDTKSIHTMLEYSGTLVNETSNVNGYTALQFAAQDGHLAALRLLLQRSANVEATLSTPTGETALLLAASAGEEAIVHELLEWKANVLATTKTDRHSALALAVLNNHEDVVSTLLEWQRTNGIFIVNALSTFDGKTPLILAADEGNLEITRLLVENNAYLEDRTFNEENTALMAAVKWQDPDLVKVLIDAGADVEAMDYNGCRPLYVAAQLGDEDLVAILLKAGARSIAALTPCRKWDRLVCYDSVGWQVQQSLIWTLKEHERRYHPRRFGIFGRVG